MELLERRATAGLADLLRVADRCVAELASYCKPPAGLDHEHYLPCAFQNVLGAFRKVQSKVFDRGGTGLLGTSQHAT